MRWPRIRLRWLLSACLISLLLLIPRDCNGMQQVTVIRNNLLCPAPPSLSLASQTEAEMVEQIWLSCGLDMMILQDFRNQCNNLTLLFNIITNSYKTNSKNTSPPVSIKDGISSTLSPEVTSIFLDCLNKHNFRFLDGVSGHRKEEAGSLLPNSDNIEPPFASKRRYLLEVASTSHYSSSRPSKETIRSVLSSTTEGRPLVKSIKKSSKLEQKKQSENSGFSMFVIIGLIVVSIGVVALIFICFCACRGSDSASPYNLTRDDKPLLKLSDLSGSSRKSSASQIDVSRLGALSRSSSKSQETESGLTRLLKERQAGLTAHEITTIGGHQAEKPVVSSSTGSAVVPAGPAPPPPPAPRFAPVPPHPAPHSAAAPPPPAPPSAPPPPPAAPPSAPEPPPPAPQETAPALPLPPGFAQASDKKDTSAQGSAKKDGSAQGSKKKDTSAHASKLLHKIHNKKDTSAQNAKKKDTSRQESKKKESSAPPPPPKSAGSTNAPTGPPPPPAPRVGAGAGPGPPPPPPKRGGPPGAGPPPPALPGGPKGRGPPPFKKPGSAAGPVDSNKTKLKPFFWDKVNANPNQGMVWDQIKAGSFQFNEEMIENLFGAQTVDKKGADGKKDGPAKEATQFVRILDAKKAQNLAISLKALNVSAEQVRNAVTEGLDLSSDLIQTLIRWTPTSDEELRLRLYTGEITQLGHAEQFLRTIIDVPYIFQRLEALLFMASLPEEATSVKQSFATLEVACHELKNSRLFKKLLEAVLKTGNRMNDGTFRGGAQAFKLDTLLKLADVKGVDGKTTLLHFVVQEIIRSEGVRAVREAKGQSGSSSSLGGSEQRMSVSSSDDLSEDVSDDTEHYKQLGLGVVSSLGEDLQNVRKAACLDSDALSMTVASLGHRLLKANEFLTTSMKSLDEDSGFHRRLEQFIEQSQVQVTNLLSEEKKMRELVRSTVDYFHGGTAKDEGLRLFVIVRDFLAILDKVCGEVKDAFAKAAAANKKPPAAAGAPPAKGKHPGKQPSQTSLKIKPVIQNRRSSAGRSSSSSSDSDD